MRVITACLVAFALTPSITSAGTMKDMSGMSNTAAKTGSGVGVITAIDPKAAKVTIKHGQIPAIGWPAMTMTFKAVPPVLLKGVHVGQTVVFDVWSKGTNTEVTAIHPQ